MKKKNKGSAIIEITLLVPVLFGCIFFYIMSMLFLVEHGKMVDIISEKLYAEEKTVTDSVISYSGCCEYNDGSTKVAEYTGEYEKYDIVLELKKYAGDTVKNLRRWQLVADTIR